MIRRMAWIMLILGLQFSSCAMHPLKGRGQENLDAWDRSRVYDPVTGKYYHNQTARSMQEAQHDAFVQDVIED